MFNFWYSDEPSWPGALLSETQHVTNVPVTWHARCTTSGDVRKRNGNMNTLRNVVVGISLVSLLGVGANSGASPGDGACDELSPAEILKNVQDRYTSLTSYCDEGYVITDLEGASVVPFTTHLARPNFYRIEWTQSSGTCFSAPNTVRQAVWSAGVLNFLIEGQCGLQKERNRRVALSRAAGPSRGATATVPRIFFETACGDQGEQIADWTSTEKREADENLGNQSCYVLTRECQGTTNTLWIGKQDFLIRQVKTTMTTEALQAAAMNVLGLGPEITTCLRGFTSTETHINIVVNQPLSHADFVPSFPLLARSATECLK